VPIPARGLTQLHVPWIPGAFWQRQSLRGVKLISAIAGEVFVLFTLFLFFNFLLFLVAMLMHKAVHPLGA
jgi:hypothetical protein